MAKATWNITIDGTPHEVVLEWGYWNGDRKVYVDGQLVDHSTRALRWESTQVIEIDGEKVTVITRPNYPNIAAFKLELVTGGEVLPPDVDER